MVIIKCCWYSARPENIGTLFLQSRMLYAGSLQAVPEDDGAANGGRQRKPTSAAHAGFPRGVRDQLWGSDAVGLMGSDTH